jgi:Tn7-like transposition protein D/TniQ
VIGYFPPPHPDELLYNIIARLSSMGGFRSQRGVGEDLFASPTATAVADLPHRLGSLVRQVHESTGLSADILIDKHTLWPYWAAFHSAERRAGTRSEMTSLGHPYLSLGLMATRSPWLRYFRYCRVCIEEDRGSEFGEAYWHRTHQIPGILVCNRHGEPLQDSNVEFRDGRGRFAYISAESPGALEGLSTERTHCRSEVLLDVEMRLARGAAWLLANPAATKSGPALQERYLWELALRGEATWNGHLRTASLLDRFCSHYPLEWLSSVGCGLPDRTGESWLERLLHRPQSSQTTFRHQLLIDFLELTPEAIICSENPPPFGSGPWPCLNRAADHHGELTVHGCEIVATRNGSSLLATFSCPLCGMAYQRHGPDRDFSDSKRRDRIPAYGTMWEQMLRDLLSTPATSLRQVSRHLGVDPRTAHLQSVRLGLRSDRDGGCPSPVCQQTVAEPGPRCSIEGYRAEWLVLCQRTPSASRTELRKLGAKYYAFLRRHDRPWLEDHYPPRQITKQIQSRVNWPDRDLAISTQIAVVTERLLRARPPLQLTRTAILRTARLSWTIHKLDRLPTTAAMLATIAESRIDFACRRIRIVAADWNPENAPIPRWRLIRTANLRSDLLNYKEVVDAMTNAISSLNARSPGLKSVEHQVPLIQSTTDPAQEELPSASNAEFPPSVLNCMRNVRTALDVGNSNITCRQ